jgi:hypothetical protein
VDFECECVNSPSGVITPLHRELPREARRTKARRARSSNRRRSPNAGVTVDVLRPGILEATAGTDPADRATRRCKPDCRRLSQ